MNIAVIGAGNGGKSIIASFSKLEDIKIKLVVDTNDNAPGMVLARQLGIRCSNSLESIDASDIDLIIEVTGSDRVRDLVYEKYSSKCQIIDSKGALLIMNLVKRDIETVDKLNRQVEAIRTTTSNVEGRLKEMIDSIDSVHGVSERLIQFAKISDQYIDRISEIIQYVNKIAQQTKVLGINAKIEAMRAGESGRTFSIVASEIQDLARDSESNSKEIKSILSKLLEEIKQINVTVDDLKKLSNIQEEASSSMEVAIDSLVEQVRNY